MTAVAYAACGAAIAGCCEYVISVQTGRSAIARARWAWRCRGNPPVRDEGGERLTRDEIQVLGNLDAGRDVRART